MPALRYNRDRCQLATLSVGYLRPTMPDPSAEVVPSLQSSPILSGERVAFTGTLASMTHRQAMEMVEQHGGTAMQHVGQQTSILVVGEEGWPLEPDGLPSVKLEQARQLHDKGEPIRIVSESEWLKLLGIEPVERKTHQLYTPAMLCQLLNVSVHDIRRWERAGLITSVKKVYRLPYFDFEEVANARRLSKLAASGVRSEQIAASLQRLHTLWPDVVKPLAQLEVMSRGMGGLVFRDDSGLVETTGQRIFDFDPPSPEDEPSDEHSILPLHPAPVVGNVDRQHWTVDEWFYEGCRLAEANELESALEAMRMATIGESNNPLFHFHIADVLYRLKKPDGAIERYYMAVEIDHDFLEAWTQLGCVLSEIGDLAGAQAAFQIALDLHPDCPEVHFHLAGVLEQLGQPEAAVQHWRRYLDFDDRGPWAEIAREHVSPDAQ